MKSFNIRAWISGLSKSISPYDRAFLYLLAISIFLGLLWLDRPPGALIFDEKYYVNVARILVGLPHDADVYAGAPPFQDPNKEHPPLAKLIIALFVSLLGDNAYGWRLASVLFGALTLMVFYLTMRKLAGGGWLPLLSSFTLAFDNLFFVHSRIATLDIFGLFFMASAIYFYAAGKPLLSSTAAALSALTKISGVTAYFIVASYHAAKHLRKNGLRDLQALLSWLERYTLAFGLIFVVLLAIFDNIWVKFVNPFDHLSYIFNYTLALTRPFPQAYESYPWQWLYNEVKIPYLVVSRKVIVNGGPVRTETLIAFIGAMNPLVIYLAIPAIAYAAYAALKKHSEIPLLALLWFTFTYLPYVPMALFWHRIMYIFYFLNTVPAVTAAIAYLILDLRPPRLLVLLYIAAVLVGFAHLFPFKSLPA